MIPAFFRPSFEPTAVARPLRLKMSVPALRAESNACEAAATPGLGLAHLGESRSPAEVDVTHSL